MMGGKLMWRKSVNAVMLSVTAVFTLLAVFGLFLILGYLVYYGGRSLDWNFFTKLPLPPGEIGGGMANAIVGSLEIVGMAALIGLPVGRWLRGLDLNQRPLGYEPNELPDCSTPQTHHIESRVI